jgi:hypothetical protein
VVCFVTTDGGAMASCSHLEVDENSLEMKLVENKTYKITGFAKCKNCDKTWHADSWKVLGNDTYDVLKKLRGLFKD